MEAYAILETGGKQTLVKVGDKIEIEKLSVEAGKDVELDTVCAISDGNELKVGTPYVDGAVVKATVLDDEVKADKVLVFKKIRRKGYQKLNGHRQKLTKIKINEIA